MSILITYIPHYKKDFISNYDMKKKFTTKEKLAI